MRLLVLMPALNEEKTITHVIKSVPLSIPGVEKVDILVINDGSNDKTGELARSAGAEVIDHGENLGLGLTFQQGVHEALKRGYDALVNIDSDGQFAGNDILELVRPIVEQKADFVAASRFKDKKLIPQMPLLKKWGNKVVARLISTISSERYYDVSCGFRVFSREALLNLNLFSKFTYTHEVFMNLIYKNLSIIEIPVTVRGERKFGKSKMANNLWKYGYNMFNTILRTMLDYKPLKFFGWSGILFFLVGLFLDFFIGLRLFIVGQVTPFKSLGFAGLSLNIFGLLLLIVGLLADMINRSRLTQEKILYYEKKRNYER